MASCRKQIVNGIPGKSIWISRSLCLVGIGISFRVDARLPQRTSCTVSKTILQGHGFRVGEKLQTRAPPWKSGSLRAARGMSNQGGLQPPWSLAP
jgi:hypothetical protein